MLAGIHADLSRVLVSQGIVIKQLRNNYWELDPYVRSRTILDRTGVIKGGGRTDFYATKEAVTALSDEV